MKGQLQFMGGENRRAQKGFPACVKRGRSPVRQNTYNFTGVLALKGNKRMKTKHSRWNKRECRKVAVTESSIMEPRTGGRQSRDQKGRGPGPGGWIKIAKGYGGEGVRRATNGVLKENRGTGLERGEKVGYL